MKTSFHKLFSGILPLVFALSFAQAFAQVPNHQTFRSTEEQLPAIASTTIGVSTSGLQAKSWAIEIEERDALPDSTLSSEENEPVVLVKIPETNCEIRIWYNYQVIAISKLNEYWIEKEVALKERAKKAFEVRHNARLYARSMMQNKEEVAQLQKRDKAKYGNPDGPTFEYLMKKCKDKGLTEEQCYQEIIDSSSRVSQVYNAECE